MAGIDERFIVKLQGKDFVTYEGLLDLAHQKGLKSIEVVLIQIPTKENDMTAICMATAKTENEIYTDIGDANFTSVNKNIAPHIVRMASTRAKARALRDLTNVGMTAIEELGESTEASKVDKEPKKKGKLSDKQIQRLYAIAKAAGYTIEQVKTDVKKQLNIEVSELSKQQYDAICEVYEKQKK
ncbi:hypothetical protein ACR77J_15775 [Tissierella praeacuta]|uniref:hypothetical protein n=1 Tax=Tissierella praeacuta TaxID=43131 RepID=UPI003DA4B032